MKAIKGKTRFVLVFPAHGFVLKLPIIHVFEALKAICSYCVKGHWKRLIYICRKWSPESSIVISGLMLGGLVANRRESALWNRTHHPLLQPTLFSFFGLINVQLYGKAYDCCHYLDLWDQIRRITNQEAYLNPHQFSEPANYCLADEKLRLLDYGGKGSARVVLKYGEKIRGQFNLNFRYADHSTDAPH